MAKKNDVYPLVSVVVPVYNVEKYLVRCIESILGQTYKNLELILVDDGSKDTSLDICHEYQKKDTRVKVLQQENAGSSVARNTGLSIANGEYIGFVDSDDWIKPEMFEDMVNFAIKNQLAVVECGQITSKEIRSADVEINKTFLIESKEEAMGRIIKTDRFAVWKRIYKKEILLTKTFIPGKIHQDVFYTMDILDETSKIGVISSKYYVYNIDNESVIRSAYNLKKLDAKDAVFYVQKIASKYNGNVSYLGNQYLIRGLINHYVPLFENEHLDSDFKHRRQIKKEIRCQFKNLPSSWNRNKLEAAIIIYSPFSLYKQLLRINKIRIDLKLKIEGLLNV